MHIPRLQLKKIQSLSSKKVIVLYGPRRVGKTTLLKEFLEEKKNYLFVTGEDFFIKDMLSVQSIERAT